MADVTFGHLWRAIHGCSHIGQACCNRPGCFAMFEVNVVEKLSNTELKVKVVRGGKLKARKGVNVPDVEIDCAALTAKDIEDAEFLLQLDPPIEYICVSFVQKGQDLQELIDIMDRLKIPQDTRGLK